MTLKECYEKLDGDYKDVLGRLGSERMVQKFMLKFLDDGSFGNLCCALDTGNCEEAFRAAHTIKGICQNLGFTKLWQSSSAITETLRSGDTQGAEAMLDNVREDYERTVNAIRMFQTELLG